MKTVYWSLLSGRSDKGYDKSLSSGFSVFSGGSGPVKRGLGCGGIGRLEPSKSS